LDEEAGALVAFREQRRSVRRTRMKIDGFLGVYAGAGDVDAGDAAKKQEDAGYDGVWAPETSHDPLLSLAFAAKTTDKLELGTAIVVAFGRSPMDLAITANDIQLLSKGRLNLGLGSQIKPHIEKRFSMPWSHPARRMREFVLAMRAIWDSWNDNTKLDFRGEFYTHTLMTPFFNPGPNPYGAPKVYVAGVGEKMTEVAGEVCDGFLSHAFSTPAYFRDVTIPALERGLKKSGRTREGFEVTSPGFLVLGNNDTEVEAAAAGVRQQIAFYGSTPAYRPVLEKHGWGDLQTELNTMSKRGEWVEMAKLITDDVLSEFAIVGRTEDVPKEIENRYGGLATRIGFGISRANSATIEQLRAL
jgi:probable F420-dependent oxidoreductase